MSCWSHTGAPIVTPPYREEVASSTATESIKPPIKAQRKAHTSPKGVRLSSCPNTCETCNVNSPVLLSI